MIINKITPGFVSQTYDTERDIWINQEFVAGDDVSFEDENGKPCEPIKEYLNMEMTQPIKHKYVMEISNDEDAEDPREHMLTTVYQPDRDNRSRIVGTKGAVHHSFVDEPLLTFDVYAYIHSGMSLSLHPFGCEWDSGKIADAYIKISDLPFDTNGVSSKERYEKAEKVVANEIEYLCAYLEGEFYQYDILCEYSDGTREYEISGGGFLRRDDAENEGNKVLDTYNGKLQEQHKVQR